MKRVLILCLLSPLALWLAYALLARPISLCVANRWGPAIIHAGQGRVTDAAVFVRHRFYDFASLTTLAAGALAAALGSGALWARRWPSPWKWVPCSATGFVAMNLLVAWLGANCLFWSLFWIGKSDTCNFTQFHLKLLLLRDNPAPTKIVLAGSSQAHNQIDASLLNSRSHSNFFAEDLHLPGSHAYEFLWLNSRLRQQPVDAIVCYLSELNFYHGGVSEIFSLSFTPRDLLEFLRLGGRPSWGPRQISYGLLGDLLPVFRMRDPIAQRLLGKGVTAPEPREPRDKARPSPGLAQRAVDAAPSFHEDAQSRFQFAAFEAFVAQCRAQRRSVVLCCGQLNPLLARRLNPALHSHMLTFLRRLAAEYDNVVLLEDLPAQTEDDYEDLSHVLKPAQARFTEALARALQDLNLKRGPTRTSVP